MEKQIAIIPNTNGHTKPDKYSDALPIDYLPVGINIFDLEGKVVYVNNIARQYFGVSVFRIRHCF